MYFFAEAVAYYSLGFLLQVWGCLIPITDEEVFQKRPGLRSPPGVGLIALLFTVGLVALLSLSGWSLCSSLSSWSLRMQGPLDSRRADAV